MKNAALDAAGRTVSLSVERSLQRASSVHAELAVEGRALHARDSGKSFGFRSTADSDEPVSLSHSGPTSSIGFDRNELATRGHAGPSDAMFHASSSTVKHGVVPASIALSTIMFKLGGELPGAFC